MHRPSPSRRSLVGVAAALLLAALAVPSAATTAATSSARPSDAPADRYALAGGCFAVKAVASGRYVARSTSSFAATAGGAAAAEPFRFQASDLGRYLLFGSKQDFLAAATGPLAGSGITRATTPGPTGDFRLDERPGGYRLTLQSDGRVLSAAPDGSLSLVPSAQAGPGSRFDVTRRSGCAVFPEIDVNVAGEPKKGRSPVDEVRGYLDPALHGMAFEFIGGSLRCGRPWSPYGVTVAMVDCPDHGPNGSTAAVENVLSYGNPVGTHDTTGWPSFKGWPSAKSLTHEQVYYRSLERAHRGGLRMMTQLFVDNAALCKTYPLKRNSCNEMDGVRLQAQRNRELERYIDAQSGGPGKGWFRIVTSPEQARAVINDGKLAVVLGIEVSTLFDCGLSDGVPLCDKAKIDQQLDAAYRLGVRQLQLVNKFDNAFSGVTGDGGPGGIVINLGNRGETGRFWDFRACPKGRKDADKAQTTAPGADALATAVLQQFGPPGAAPVYGPGPHCNVLGLSELGKYLITRMIDKGMILDTDHMSVLARDQALTLLERAGYSGVMSSHGWSTPEGFDRTYRLGGMVAPRSGSTEGFLNGWREARPKRDPRFFFGIGIGSDVSGLGAQPGPVVGNKNPVTYPFRGFGGVVIDKQRAGERVYDVNVDGVAQYGLYPDWVELLRKTAGPQIIEDLERGPESYLQMWERATGATAQRCDEAGVTGGVRPGMTSAEVLRAAGQPEERRDGTFVYCSVSAKATVVFGPGGRVTQVRAG